MKEPLEPGQYRDLIAKYIDKHFGPRGIVLYTEVPLGTTIIGKDRRVDILALRPFDQRAIAIEVKLQQGKGTTDEKIPYALQDLDALWIPGCLVYGGDGWSQGILHTLQAAKRAVRCEPDPTTLDRTDHTRELDHVLAAVFGFWDLVIPEARLFTRSPQLPLLKGPTKARAIATQKKKVADEDG